MKMQIRTFAILSIISFITACQKDAEEPTPTQPSVKMKLITAKPWRITAWERMSFGAKIDEYQFTIDCKKDDTYTLKNDGTWALNINAKKCNYATPSADNTKYSGTWAFAENESKLTISAWATAAGTWDIIELSDATLKIGIKGTTTTSSGASSDYTATITLANN